MQDLQVNADKECLWKYLPTDRYCHFQIAIHKYSIYWAFLWLKSQLWKSYWVSQKVHVFFSVKQETDFSFSPMTLLIRIFWVWSLSPVWCIVDCSQLMSQFDCYRLQLVYPTMEQCPRRNLRQKISQTTFDRFDRSQHLLHNCTILFCLSLSCIFTFLEMMRNMLKRLHIFFLL